MIQALNDKSLELYVKFNDFLYNLKHGERGQTSAEYVAVTAVGVVIAVTVLWSQLDDAINTAIGDIGDKITTFVDEEGSGGGGGDD
jgi:Flp pilus assembly pilin Flp